MNGMDMYLAAGIAFYIQALRMQIIGFGVSNQELMEDMSAIGVALFMVLAFFLCMAAWPWLAYQILKK